MADFQRNDPHWQLRQTVGKFADEIVAPVIGDLYERAEFPYDIVARMGRMGLFGLTVDAEHGGTGGDFTSLCVALEELGRVDSSVGATLESAVTLAVMPIYRHGTRQQKLQWLPALCAGQLLGAFGLTEPGSGTDAAGSMRTTARLTDGHWVIDGTKAFITNSGTSITGLILVAAVTGTRDDGRPEISTILVPAGTAGLRVGPAYSKVGWACSDTHELSFDGCRVPAANLLGGRGRGLAQFLAALDEGRIALAALATGLAQGCLDESVRYVQDRTAFGGPIGRFQALQFTIADMAARAHTARLAWQHAAALLAAGQPFKKEAAIAKLTASGAAMDNARDATQLFGGYGFLNSSPVGRFYRDAKAMEIAEGTSEVQRMLIARELGLTS